MKIFTMNLKALLLLLFVATLFTASCKRKKDSPPSTTADTIYASIGNNYKYWVYVYPKFTVDGNMLAVVCTNNNTMELLKINTLGAIIWHKPLLIDTVANYERYFIKEFDNNTYSIFSNHRVQEFDHTGTLIRSIQDVTANDAYKSNGDYYTLRNLSKGFQFKHYNSQFSLLDSFSRIVTPSLMSEALFNHQGKIEWLYSISLSGGWLGEIYAHKIDFQGNTLDIDSTEAPNTFHSFLHSSDRIILCTHINNSLQHLCMFFMFDGNQFTQLNPDYSLYATSHYHLAENYSSGYVYIFSPATKLVRYGYNPLNAGNTFEQTKDSISDICPYLNGELFSDVDVDYLAGMVVEPVLENSYFFTSDLSRQNLIIIKVDSANNIVDI